MTPLHVRQTSLVLLAWWRMRSITRRRTKPGFGSQASFIATLVAAAISRPPIARARPADSASTALASIVASPTAPPTDKWRALDRIQERLEKKAAEPLARFATNGPVPNLATPDDVADFNRLRTRAIQTAFQLDASKAAKVIEAFLADRDRNLGTQSLVLEALGELSDPSSLKILVQLLESPGHWRWDAARQLARRRDPQAEEEMASRFAQVTQGVADIFAGRMRQSGGAPSIRAFLRWAVSRRDVRDDVSSWIRQWISRLGSGAFGTLAELASEEKQSGELIRGLVARCSKGAGGADPAHWEAWARSQSQGSLKQLQDDRGCALPGLPEETPISDGAKALRVVEAAVHSGEAGGGAYWPGKQPVAYTYERFVFQPVDRPAFFYSLTFRNRCYRLIASGICGDTCTDHEGLWPSIAPGQDASFYLDIREEGLLAVKPESSCAPSGQLGSSEGEVVFFVGEAKYSVRFPIAAVQDPPAMIPSRPPTK